MPVSDILGELSFDFTGVANTLIIIFMVFIIFIMTIACIAFFVVKKRKVNINLFQERSGGGSYRFISMKGKRKFKKGSAFLRLWRVGIVDKLVPDVDTDYIYQDKQGKDILNLVMDKRGFIHKMKLPNLSEVCDFMIFKKLMAELSSKKVGNPETINVQAVEAILKRKTELEQNFIRENPEYDVVGMPNIHETIDFISSQVQEAKKQFGGFMEQHGTLVMFGGTVMACIILLVMAMIFSSKIFGG